VSRIGGIGNPLNEFGIIRMERYDPRQKEVVDIRKLILLRRVEGWVCCVFRGYLQPIWQGNSSSMLCCIEIAKYLLPDCSVAG
jgi:hypothetical protein